MTKKNKSQPTAPVPLDQIITAETFLASEPQMLSVRRYKEIMGIGHTTAAKHISKNIVHSVRIEGRRLIYRDSVVNLLLGKRLYSEVGGAQND